MWPRTFVRVAVPVYASITLLLTLGLLLAGGRSLAQRDAPTPPAPHDSDGLRGLPAIDAAADELEAPQAFTGCANVKQIPQSECRALVRFYHATNGPNWRGSISGGWLIKNQPCKWLGVTCADGHVIELRAEGRVGLQGKLPAALRHLKKLEQLWLRYNRLTGTIPASIGQLTNLTHLNLTDNELSGAIPPELGQLENLQELYLYENQLSGAIPPELRELENLLRLGLAGNNLSGEIPVELSQLTSLEFLAIGDNQLGGSIPPELGQMTSLKDLWLPKSNLSGSIPSELSQLENLENLWLSDNQLSGEIPVELSQLDNLFVLELDNNQLSGSIPPELGQSENLRAIYLNNNQLSGEIPAELGLLSELVDLELDNNQLSGSIPPELGQLGSLWMLRLNNNKLSGPIPATFGQLTSLFEIYLADNQLSGIIPAELHDLDFFDLVTADIRFNALTATDLGLITFLNDIQPNWQYYQTVPPTNISLTVDAFQDIIVSWTPVPRDVSNLKGWYYEVGCGTVSGGPYDAVSLSTKNIYTSQLTFSALADDTYFCAVRTFSAPRPGDEEGSWSEWSAEVSGTVTDAPDTVRGDSFDAPVVMKNLNAQFWSLNAEDAGADPTLPVPSCATDIDPAVHHGIIYQLPVDLSGDLAVISGGPRYFKDRDPDTADTVLAIYNGDAFPTPLAEVACDDDNGPVGGGSNILLTTYEPGVTYTAIVWMRDVGSEGLVFDVDQTQILNVNGDFSVANPNNAKLPRKWTINSPGSSRLLCDVVGAPSRVFSPACAFQLVADADQSPVLQQVVNSTDFPAKIASGIFQGAAYVKRMNTSGAARLGIEITYKNGQKVKEVIAVSARECDDEAECGEPYYLVKTPLLMVEKAVKSVRVFVRLDGDEGRVRVDDVILYYIP